MRLSIFFVLSILILTACNSQKQNPVKTYKYTNALINESSPYLLQHAHNPVDWRAWNEETLEEAKKKKKLLIISIGYAACHWCHVMEHESFEDTTVAAVMNKHFIPIKVDREERPDIDQVYINAVQLMTGSAGWPLNVVALPDGRPVFGGTYFKKEQWIKALEQVQSIYETEPEKLYEYASKLEEGIKSMDLVSFNTSDKDFSSFPTQAIVKKWKNSFSKAFGGYNRAPKFMMPNNWEFLLRYGVKDHDNEVTQQVFTTLDKMAYGGLFDQIGGGFARYSTDTNWHIPHFEKMLYDNAQLVSLYSHGFQVSKKPLYEEIVRETLAFVAREMTNEEGAFYSSLDADSTNEDGHLEEGAYYVFNKEELKPLLGEDFEIFSEYYNVNNFGKWEKDNYVLIRTKSDEDIATKFSISLEELKRKKGKWKSVLLTYREKREHPRLDDKTLTSWNGLMIKGYVDAYKTFGDKEYLDVALKNAHFILSKQLKKDGGLYHTYKNGESSINGYLEDYASIIEAFIALYEVTFDQRWINHARQLTDYTIDNFFDSDKHMFYFTSKQDSKLLTRTIEYRDNVIPASNSIMAKNLFILSHHFDEGNFDAISQQMLHNVLPEIETYPIGYSNWLDLLSNYQDKFYEVVIVGKNAVDKVKEINRYYLPNKLLAGSTVAQSSPLLEQRFMEGQTLFYICVNNACKMPVSTTQEALKLLED